jgi:hypothetical protein
MRKLLLLPLAWSLSTAAAPAESFDRFWPEFAAAVGRGDRAAVRTRTAFPFQIEGVMLDASRFDRIWTALFAPAQRQCLAKAVPIAEDDRRTIFCGAYIYYFAERDGRWQLVEFGADPEGY